MAQGGWLRLYDEVLDDPKVQKLSGDDFKAWINLLCLARRHDGILPDLEAIAFALRMSVDGARTVLERLLNGTLIDRRSGGVDGAHYAPHGWDKRQYKSDGSTERVKRFRERSKTVTETPPETETDTESETEKKREGDAPNGATAEFAFFGRTIRLKPRHLDEWRRVFHAIPDIVAELHALDGWFDLQDEKKRANWFYHAKGALNRKHQEILERRNEAESDVGIGI